VLKYAVISYLVFETTDILGQVIIDTFVSSAECRLLHSYADPSLTAFHPQKLNG